MLVGAQFIGKATGAKPFADSWSRLVFQHQARMGNCVSFPELVNVVSASTSATAAEMADGPGSSEAAMVQRGDRSDWRVITHSYQNTGMRVDTGLAVEACGTDGTADVEMK